MRYKGAPPRRGGCTIEKQMLVPKKHLKLTLMRHTCGVAITSFCTNGILPMGGSCA